MNIRENYELNTLRQFLRANQPLLLVLGERGAGKTALLTSIVKKTKISRYIMHLQGSANIKVPELIEILTKHWAVYIPNRRAKLQHQLSKIINCLSEHNQSCLLIIDDAHQLPLTVLAAILHLAYLQERQTIHLHILLFGERTLETNIQSLRLKSLPTLDLSSSEKPNESPHRPRNRNKKPTSVLSHVIKKYWGAPILLFGLLIISILLPTVFRHYQKQHEQPQQLSTTTHPQHTKVTSR